MKGFWTIGLLLLSNTFMTLAWYGHLKYASLRFAKSGLLTVILISWGIALLEYCFMVPPTGSGSKKMVALLHCFN